MNNFSGNKFALLRSDDDEPQSFEDPAIISNSYGGPISGLIMSDKNPLEHPYTFWISKRKSVLKGKNYNDCMKDIGTVYNVQDFWKLYSFMKRPSKIDDSCDLMMFKRGIRPVWEEAANKDGGRWTLRVRRHNTDRYWENAIMAMIGEQFLVGDEICGIVLSLRNPWDQLSIWHRNSVDKFVVKKISESLKRILNLNVNSASGPQMDYRPHNETLNKAEQRRTSRDERRRNTSSDQDSEEKSSS